MIFSYLADVTPWIFKRNVEFSFVCPSLTVWGLLFFRNWRKNIHKTLKAELMNLKSKTAHGAPPSSTRGVNYAGSCKSSTVVIAVSFPKDPSGSHHPTTIFHFAKSLLNGRYLIMISYNLIINFGSLLCCYWKTFSSKKWIIVKTLK